MPAKRIVKLLGLAIVGAFASFAVSSIEAQVRVGSPRARQASPDTPVEAPKPRPAGDAVVVPGMVAPGPRAANPFETAPSLREINPLATYWTKSFSVDSQGGDVVVDCAIGLQDRRPDSQYFWLLRVATEAAPDVVLLGRVYSDQVFTIPVDAIESPTFHERFRFGPGNYRVELALCRKTSDEAANLANPEWLNGHRAFKFSRRIQVGE